MLLPAQGYHVTFLSYQLPGAPPLFLPLYEKVGHDAFAVLHSFSAYASVTFPGLLQLGCVFEVLILTFIFYETNFHWFNLVCHRCELNTSDTARTHTPTLYM
jgi:hypothetical protein